MGGLQNILHSHTILISCFCFVFIICYCGYFACFQGGGEKGKEMRKEKDRRKPSPTFSLLFFSSFFIIISSPSLSFLTTLFFFLSHIFILSESLVILIRRTFDVILVNQIFNDLFDSIDSGGKPTRNLGCGF